MADSLLLLHGKPFKTEATLRCYNWDGREFVDQMVSTLASESQKRGEDVPTRPLFHHVVMNLPASAIEFLGSNMSIFPAIFHSIVR